MTDVKTKLSHKKFRALLKKLRRKRVRRQIAIETCESDNKEKTDIVPSHLNNIDERLKWIEDEDERIAQHQLWLQREVQAQIDFEIRQEEFKKQAELQLHLEEDKTKDEIEELTIDGSKLPYSKENTNGPSHNPEPPTNFGTELDQQNCPFFLKTGACRFGDRCSRTHVRPSLSSTVLIPGMYNHFSIAESLRDEYDTDIGLEYEESETYQHFREFYEDVLPEFQKVGDVIQFKVCCNHEPHLRGNVYVQFRCGEQAAEAYKAFNGRWYASKQLSCEFATINKWRSAICGLFAQKRCPKGKSCNFLHVFRNPCNEFRDADFDQSSPRYNRTSRRYSHSRSRTPERHKRGHSHSSCTQRSRDYFHQFRENSRSHHKKRSCRSKLNLRERNEDGQCADIAEKKHKKKKKNHKENGR